ncbi:hypothetical protein E2986_02717 [Frieseomelitta varia]|uniref:Uncharacterized protein n=1 Tax=Frieseomelitta varia TaxID=561572 RepID=A0A833RX29_9HYME|nr:hypothetical protein E2986_02717 [Frieseomelitta varia]
MSYLMSSRYETQPVYTCIVDQTRAPSAEHRPATDTSICRIDFSRPRKTDRRYSRSSSASESSNVSSEVPCFSSSASTPSLSRNSSNERERKNGKLPVVESSSHEKKHPSNLSSQVESEKETRSANGGAILARPPPPPPPPPPLPDKEDVVVLVVNAKQNTEPTARDEKRDVFGEANRNGRSENLPLSSTAVNKSDASCGEHQQPEVPPASPPADTEEIKTSQTSHLVNKHMVLPFIPPKFANADSNTLLKPSEYLKSICKISSKSSLLKTRSVTSTDDHRDTKEQLTVVVVVVIVIVVVVVGGGGDRSVDNLDIQSRGRIEGSSSRSEGAEELASEVTARRGGGGGEGEGEGEEEAEGRVVVVIEEGKESSAGPPPPPLSPLRRSRLPRSNDEPTADPDSPRVASQPLATISIQDLTSIQLRRTTAKMNATKTFSAPPPRSVSMTNESFFVQKTDLIAELKRTKDIPGIKKLKVEMAQVEKTQEQNLMSEINKAFNVSNFVDQTHTDATTMTNQTLVEPNQKSLSRCYNVIRRISSSVCKNG